MPDVSTDGVSRRWWLPFVGVVAYMVIAALVLFLLGVAGYRLGWLLSAVALSAVSGGLLVLTLGRGFPARVWWVALVVLIGVGATSWLVDHAPLSHGRLRDRVAAIHLQFVKVVSEHDTGHSWCRPTCPEITRVYEAPATTTFKAIFDTAALMRVHGQLRDIEPVARRHPQHFLRVPDQRTITEVRADEADGGIRLTIRVIARRSRVRHPGPIQSDSWTSSRIE